MHTPSVVRLYYRSATGLSRLFLLMQSCFAGFWLGILRRDTFHAIDQLFYDQSAKYSQDAYNRQGLWKWEQEIISRYFAGCRRLLVGGAGGGREVLALSKLGYEVDGFECHPGLAQFANDLLQREGFGARVHRAERDQCPQLGEEYDGLVVGWGAYMLIAGRQRRIAFLKAMRAQAREGAPILVSFYDRAGSESRFKLIAAIGNVLRWLLRREPLDVGDDLAPNYVHYFTREQIAAELHEVGFDPVFYDTREYGHAVGTVRLAEEATPVRRVTTAPAADVAAAR
jgi:hypothetical protein